MISPYRYLVKFLLLIITTSAFLLSCKDDSPAQPETKPVEEEETIIDPVDPELAKTMGFFMESWKTKTFAKPPATAGTVPSSASTSVTVDVAKVLTKIPETIYGHNANTWMTTMIGEPAFMTHITNLKPNIIRWPAGSGSDAYFWNAKPGELPTDVPEKLLDNSGVLKDPGYGYGKTNDDWRASLDNYYSVLAQSNSKGVITINYGYARYGTSANPVATAAHLAAEWVRYDKGRTPYWEIGNEVYADWEWGYRIDVSKNKDGQPEFLNGKLYAQHFKVYADSMRKAAAEVGATIRIGAVMYESEPQSWQVNTTKTWNTQMFPEIGDKADFYIVHNYFTPYDQNSTATVVMNSALSEPARLMDFVKKDITDKKGILKPIAMTEWNMWARSSKQQVSNISGIFAVFVIGEALKNNYGLTARWDLFNYWADGDDHGLFSDGREPGVTKWTPRPSFFYLYYLQKCMGDRLVEATTVSGNNTLKTYASSFTSGETGVTLVNTSTGPQAVEVKIKNFKKGAKYYWYSLEGDNDNGEFSRKVIVNGKAPAGVAGGPSDYATLNAFSADTQNGIKVTVPGRGAVMLVVEGK